MERRFFICWIILDYIFEVNHVSDAMNRAPTFNIDKTEKSMNNQKTENPRNKTETFLAKEIKRRQHDSPEKRKHDYPGKT